MSDFDDLNGTKLPDDAKRIFSEKKGIGLFFGELEAKFFDQAARELTINTIQESFILYRIDLKRTKTHALYGEAIVKEYKDPVEIFALINVEVSDPTYRTTRGIVKQGMGQLTASLHLSHLEEIGILKKDGNNLDVDMKKGDYLSHKGQFYEIWDDGYAQISNEYSYAGDRRAFLTIKAKEVDRDVFNGV